MPNRITRETNITEVLKFLRNNGVEVMQKKYEQHNNNNMRQRQSNHDIFKTKEKNLHTSSFHQQRTASTRKYKTN